MKPPRIQSSPRPQLRAEPASGPRPVAGNDRGSFQKRPQHAPQQGGAAPAGTVWLYGIHPVAAALANPHRRARRLLLTEEGQATLTARLPPPWAQQHERIDRSRLDQMLGRDTVHQGIALLADPLPQPTLTAVLDRPGPLLVLDQVTDPRNVGAILRSAAAFGVAGVIVQDRHAPEETGALAKAASGALETLPLIRAVNLARTLVALKAAGLWTVGLAADAPGFARHRHGGTPGGAGAGRRGCRAAPADPRDL